MKRRGTYLDPTYTTVIDLTEAGGDHDVPALRIRGVVDAGYEADLIAVEKNPLDNVTTVQDPLLVVSNGRVGLDRLDFAKQRPAS